MQDVINNNYHDYTCEIGHVNLGMTFSDMEINDITITSGTISEENEGSSSEIANVKFEGINVLKIIFKKKIEINAITISGIFINGKFTFTKKPKSPKISQYDISVCYLLLDKIEICLKSTSTSETYLIKDGKLTAYDLQVRKLDTISSGIIQEMDFYASKLMTATSDSMYTSSAFQLKYSEQYC